MSCEREYNNSIDDNKINDIARSQFTVIVRMNESSRKYTYYGWPSYAKVVPNLDKSIELRAVFVCILLYVCVNLLVTCQYE